MIRQTAVLALMLLLFACSQEKPKTDWLENAPELAPSASTADDESLSNVGHASHSGHR